MNVKVTIPNVYRRQLLDVMLFGYILGQKSAILSCSTHIAIENFKTRLGLSEDDLGLGTAIQIFHRMNKELARSESSIYLSNNSFMFTQYKLQFLRTISVGYTFGQYDMLKTRKPVDSITELLSFLAVDNEEFSVKEGVEYYSKIVNKSK